MPSWVLYLPVQNAADQARYEVLHTDFCGDLHVQRCDYTQSTRYPGWHEMQVVFYPVYDRPATPQLQDLAGRYPEPQTRPGISVEILNAGSTIPTTGPSARADHQHRRDFTPTPEEARRVSAALRYDLGGMLHTTPISSGSIRQGRPIDPQSGEMWYDHSVKQVFIWSHGEAIAVAELDLDRFEHLLEPNEQAPERPTAWARILGGANGPEDPA